MDLRVVRVGKGRDRLLADLAERYEERLARFAKVVAVHVPEAEGRRAAGKGRGADESRRLEAGRIREVLGRWARRGSGRASGAAGRPSGSEWRPSGSEWIVMLDERGTPLDSRQLATQLSKAADRGAGHAAFVIGGDDGLDPALLDEATLVLSLSRMTFTHELARVLLMEQLYRAHSILAGHPYHRD